MNDGPSDSISVIFILGPTASGKTHLSIQLAQKLGGEIINADSIQVYRSLDIGSAKPSIEELSMVTHHLVGHLPEGSNYTAGEFRKDVLDVIQKRSQAGVKRFYIVGGSGFYIKALLNGLYQIPDVPDEIQEQVESEDIGDLYEELKRVDPVSAQRINPNDSYRICRAIEVYRATETPFSNFKENFTAEKFPYKYLKIGLRTEKERLRDRVIQRTDKMLDEGLIEEVKDLLGRGYDGWDALTSIGYKEVVQYHRGLLPKENLKDEIVKNTMGLIKKQMTWFKKDEDMIWFDVFDETEKIVQFVRESI